MPLPVIYEYVQNVIAKYPPGEKILDVGPGDYEYYYQPLFKDKTFESLDIKQNRWGTIDTVANIHKKTPIADNTYDTILILDTLEHLKYPRRALKEIRRILKSGGLLICCAPLHCEIHNYPGDYWRFTPHGIKLLLEETGFKILDIRLKSRISNDQSEVLSAAKKT